DLSSSALCNLARSVPQVTRGERRRTSVIRSKPMPSAPDPALPRCGGATSDPLYIAYHDDEWGVPVHDDRRLFEMLILEGAQAGLSWITILRKRAAYRKAFDRFDPKKVARYDARRVRTLLADAGIV